jgi:hypothetical protein
MADVSSRLRKDPIPSTHGPAWKGLVVCVDVKERALFPVVQLQGRWSRLNKYTLYL